jgi:hypothetical protein
MFVFRGRRWSTSSSKTRALRWMVRLGRVVQVKKLTGSLLGDALKDVVHKRVKDSHRLVGDTSVRVNLLEH